MTTNELTMLWAKVKSYFTGLFVKQSDFANYDPLIEDTRTSATAVITANAPFATLEDGQRVTLLHKYNNGSRLRLTLSDGTITADIPIYTSYLGGGNFAYNQLGIGGYEGTVKTFVYLKSKNRWQSVGDTDSDKGIFAYSSSNIKDATQNLTGTVSAKILHEEFATNTALAGKADKVEVVNVEQTYTVGVTATALYASASEDVNEYINFTLRSKGAPLLAALAESVESNYAPIECTLTMGAVATLDEVFNSGQTLDGHAPSDFFTYTTTLDSLTLEPNKVYKIQNVTPLQDMGDERDYLNTDEISITLDTSDTSTDLKIYCFTFTVETSACQVTLPATVELGNEYEWEFAAGRKFEVSIMDNVALVAYVDAQSTNS